MALFGAPVALEAAPQRAVRSALAIHREIARFNLRGLRRARRPPGLRMRIGIHTGPVVVGTLGNDLRVEFKAVGDTVNLAARLEEMADPGNTLVSADTFKLTEGLFRFEALGERAHQGEGAGGPGIPGHRCRQQQDPVRCRSRKRADALSRPGAGARAVARQLRPRQRWPGPGGVGGRRGWPG